MRQLVQNLRSGQMTLEDVPAPGLTRNQVLIQTRATLISAGTEKMLVDFGRASLLGKARSQPDKVKQVLDKIRTDGLVPTLETVFARLDEPLPLGYCNAGVVLAVGAGVSEFKAGDRVVSNGPHAEIVAVPKTLCARIPVGVSDEHAAFTVLASIGLQGIRLAQPTFGETFVVVGLGLIGLVTAQLLRAHGCQVIGTDINARRLQLAERFGVQTVNVGAGGDPVAAAMAATGGVGVDGVLITASAKTDEIVHQAAEMCRKRGRIILVGVVGLNLRRSDFYEKELSFQVSCSYGPGRYDESYEQGGQDYPLGFVRWTEQRNFTAILAALADGKLDVEPLLTHRFPLDQAEQAYGTISQGDALGVVLDYPGCEASPAVTVREAPAVAAPAGRAVVGVIGAGNFSKMTLMPALSKTAADIKYVADLDGRAAAFLAQKGGARQAISDYKRILDDDEVNCVIIAVGHSLHARMVIESLTACKHVMVEKPLAMNVREVADILAAVRSSGGRQQLMVGFNRRFSPHSQKIRQSLAGRSEPLTMQFLANAGIIPANHWVHDPVRGGGRIVGEACHYIDLLSYYAGSPVRTVSAAMMGGGAAVHEDKMSITLGFEDGSVGTVDYFANGPKSLPKEQAVIFSQGRGIVLENFRVTTGHGFRGLKRFKTWRQDKGHAAEFAAFVDSVATGGAPLIPIEQLVNVTLASFAAMTAAAEHRTIVLAEEYGDVLSD